MSNPTKSRNAVIVLRELLDGSGIPYDPSKMDELEAYCDELVPDTQTSTQPSSTCGSAPNTDSTPLS
jgi:hypothetical protein